MKEFGKNIVLFIPFALCIYIIFLISSVEFFPAKYTPNVSYRVGYAGYSLTRFQNVDKLRNVDIIFVGSSHTYRGFDPRLFPEYTTYNLGSSSQTPIQSEMVLKRYVDQVKPKIVIYEVYPLTFTLDGVESATDLIANDKNDILSVSMSIKTNKVKVYNTLIYGFYIDLLGRYDGVIEPQNQYNDEYIKDGYVERKLAFYTNKEVEQKKKYQFLSSQFRAFTNTLDHLKSKGIKVILVQTPIPKSEFNSYTNNVEFDQLMEDQGLPYYNFNRLMSLNDSLHFYDHSHLNQNGVVLFNEKLKKVIKFDEILKH